MLLYPVLGAWCSVDMCTCKRSHRFVSFRLRWELKNNNNNISIAIIWCCWYNLFSFYFVCCWLTAFDMMSKATNEREKKNQLKQSNNKSYNWNFSMMAGSRNRTNPNQTECELFAKMDSNEMEMAVGINWHALLYLWRVHK